MDSRSRGKATIDAEQSAQLGDKSRLAVHKDLHIAVREIDCGNGVHQPAADRGISGMHPGEGHSIGDL